VAVSLPAVSISHLIETYGYVAVFLLVGVESLGIPVPGETALIVAGAYAGHTHHLSPWAIFAVAAAGAIIGENVGFWDGDRFGYRLTRKYGQRIWVHERKRKIARYIFDTHGPKVVVFGRFVSIPRTYAAFVASSSRMRWIRFLPANAAGGIVWAGFYTLAAYLAGNALTRLSGTIDFVVGGIALLGVATALFVIGRQTDRLACRAEAAYPGQLE
jgi:membrane protein DedA with SNARE-associated domain